MNHFWQDKTILITAGPTQEPLDPVRYLTNRSSGRMGYALAEQANKMAAKVFLISGPVALSPPNNVHFISVSTALDMQEAVFDCLPKIDIMISAAAVADYRSQTVASQKFKKNADKLTLTLTKNPDILKNVAKQKKRPFLVGFAAETETPIEYAMKKLVEKNLDMIAVNDVSDTSIGFDSRDNALTILSPDHQITLPKADKIVIAAQLLAQIAQYYKRKQATKNSAR